MTASEAKKSPSKKKGDTENRINEIISEGTGQVVKMEVDCSSLVSEKVPLAEKLAKENKLDEALELLLGLEKQTRNGSDMHSTSKVLVAIVQLCYQVN
jgi:26S proteasome regulatory subunit N5